MGLDAKRKDEREMKMKNFTLVGLLAYAIVVFMAVGAGFFLGRNSHSMTVKCEKTKCKPCSQKVSSGNLYEVTVKEDGSLEDYFVVARGPGEAFSAVEKHLRGSVWCGLETPILEFFGILKKATDIKLNHQCHGGLLVDEKK